MDCFQSSCHLDTHRFCHCQVMENKNDCTHHFDQVCCTHFLLKRNEMLHNNFLKFKPALKPQIYTRDPRPPVPARVMVSSAMGSIWGSSGFCWSRTQKQMQNRCPRSLHTMQHFMHAFIITLRLQHDAVKYAPNNPDYFYNGKNLKTPKFSPRQDQDGAGSGISGLYLWLKHIFWIMICHSLCVMDIFISFLQQRKLEILPNFILQMSNDCYGPRDQVILYQMYHHIIIISPHQYQDQLPYFCITFLRNNW